MPRIITRFLFAGLPLFSTIAGCASPPTTSAEHSAAAETAVRSFRDAVTRAVADLQLVSETLNDVQSLRGDMKERYESFAYALTTVEKQGEEARQRVEALRSRRDEYLKKWDEELGQSKDPELAARAREPRREIEADFAKISEASKAAGEAYRPYIAEMREIRRLIGVDNSPASIVPMRPRIASAQALGANLCTRLLAVLAEIDRMARARAARVAH